MTDNAQHPDVPDERPGEEPATPRAGEESLQADDGAPVLHYATHTTPRAAGGPGLVALATFNHPFEAHLAAGKLENEGIHAVVTGDAMATIGVNVTGIAGAVRLLVPAVDADRAREILPRRLWAPGQVVCRACGADRVRPGAFTGLLGFLDGLLLGLPRLFFLRPLRCDACGHQWVPKVQEDDDEEEEDEDHKREKDDALTRERE